MTRPLTLSQQRALEYIRYFREHNNGAMPDWRQIGAGVDMKAPRWFLDSGGEPDVHIRAGVEDHLYQLRAKGHLR